MTTKYGPLGGREEMKVGSLLKPAGSSKTSWMSILCLFWLSYTSKLTLHSRRLSTVGGSRLNSNVAHLPVISLLCPPGYPSLSPWIPVALIQSILAFVPIGTNLKGVDILKQKIIIAFIILTEWVHRACSE